jgi:replication initiation and membrane attachment protein DnaB
MPIGLEDVSKYPNLFEQLVQTDEPKWSTKDLKKLAGLNLIRVFKEVEKVCMRNPQIVEFLRERNQKLIPSGQFH